MKNIDKANMAWQKMDFGKKYQETEMSISKMPCQYFAMFVGVNRPLFRTRPISD